MLKLLITTTAFIGFAALSIGQTAPSYVPASGLVGWWPFDGNANDESGNGNNGTVDGPVADADRFANAGSAYYFESNEIHCGSSPSLDLDNCTMAAWIKMDTIFADWQTILSKFDNDPWGSYGLYLYDNEVSVYFQTDTFYTANVDIRSNTTISEDQWYHLVATHDTLTGVNIYINGVLDASDPTAFHAMQSPADTFRIGAQGPIYPVPMVGGTIDDVGLWNRALTPAEVADLYAATITTGRDELSSGGLISAYPNPAYSQINITTNPELMGSAYTVYDNTGRIVFAGTILSENTRVDLEELTNGIYLIRVGSDAGQAFRFVKQ